MREDMFKVIVTRPRIGSRYKPSAKSRADALARKRVTGKRLALETERLGTRYLNEHLGPLKRYLHRQVGRRWDDVFSDICARLDTGSTVKMHVREHLDDYVIRRTWAVEGGDVWGAPQWGPLRSVTLGHALFYVEPDTGVLRRVSDLRDRLGLSNRRSERRYRAYGYPIRYEAEPPARWLDANRCHAKLHGIWYALELLPKGVADDGTVKTFRMFRDRPVTAKRQLSGAELRKHGLANDPD